MTFVKPPLPFSPYLKVYWKDPDNRKQETLYLESVVQARDAEMLRAVADWLLAKRRPYNWASENADRYRGQDEAWTMAAEELRKAANE